MFQLGKDFVFAIVPVGPVGRGARGYVVVGGGAVAVDQRQRAPQRAVRLTALVAGAKGEQGGLAEILFQHAVGQGFVHGVVVEIRLAVFFRHHRTAAQAIAQGTGDITFHTQLVPGTDGTAEGHLQVFGRALAHHVDGGRGIAGAAHQAVGAAHHFDALVLGGIGFAVAVAIGGRHADTVDLEVGHIKAPGGVVGAVGLDTLNLDTGHGFQRVVQAVEAEILQLQAVDG